MLNLGFALAALVALLTFGVHSFVGSIHVVRPLLAAPDLSKASRWLNFYCWHMVTILLAAMTGVFAAAALDRIAADAAILMTVLAASFSALCVAVAIRGGVPPWRFPASYLFALITLAGAWGTTQAG